MNTLQRLTDNWTPRQKENFLEDLFLANGISALCDTILKYYKKQTTGRLTFAIIGLGGGINVFELQNGCYIGRRIAVEPPFHWEDSNWVADQLKRPLGPHRVFPIELNEGQEKVVVLMENSDVDAVSFFRLTEKLLKTSFSSLLVKHQMEDASEQWAATFEFMKDPVMVIDENRRLLRSNGNKGNELECFRKLGLEVPCEDCPMGVADRAEIITPRGRYTVLSHKVDLGQRERIYIHHYKDVSRERHLYSQVVQNQKMAAVGLLAGNIAHELSNPLAGIKALIETVKLDVAPSSDHIRDFDEIRDAAIRCQKIIQNLLTFAFDGENQALEVFDVLEVVNRTVPLLKVQLRDHHVEVSQEASFPKAIGRLSAFQQVVFNLLNNAGQAMKASGTIRIQFEHDDQNVRVLVADTGGGISGENENKIFDPFFTTKKAGEGTGLGLSVAKSLMNEMEGELEFLKNANGGAIFQITLRRDGI